MNWLDKVISFVSPRTAYYRECYKRALESYDAGSYSRLNANWETANLSAEDTDKTSRTIVKARARDLERNSDIANSLLSAYERNVIGAGYTLQATTENEELNDKIEKIWKIWCKKRNCDVTCTQNFNQMLRMAEIRKKVDGGILFKKCYTDNGIVPFQLQALEVDELDIYQTIPKNKDCKVIGGIEYNRYNRAVGYWIKQYSIDGLTLHETKYIDAEDMIYLFSKRRPSQIREMSDMSQTITRIRDTNEYITAVSVKERIGACLAIFIKKAIPTSGITTRMKNKNISYDGKKITPGMIGELNVGDEIQTVNPSGQATDSSEYLRLQQGLIGAGQGLSYEATARDMSKTNYSSARNAILEDELTYMKDKELIIEGFMDEVYETFLISAVLAGVIEIRDFWKNKEKYLAHTWVAAQKRWIDPYKEMRANETALKSLQKTFKQTAAENGKDWKEQLRDIKEVLDYGDSIGLDLREILFSIKINDIEKGGEEDE